MHPPGDRCMHRSHWSAHVPTSPLLIPYFEGRLYSMMFSTRAEYGVRVMVDLARRGGADPVPLAEIAECEGLPLAYLEHLVARLRRAGLIERRRGAGALRGGRACALEP